MVVEFGRQCRKLVVVCDHGKTFGGVLTDKRFDDRECLTATRSTDHPCTPERIDDIHPALAEFSLVVVPHGDIHAVLVLHQFRTLLETLVLKIEAVFEQTIFKKLGDIIKSDMNQYHANHGCEHIEPDVQAQGIKPCFHRITIQPYRQHNQPYTYYNRIEDLFPTIELQFLLVPRTYAGYADKKECGELTICKVTVIIDYPTLDTPMYVA